MKKILNLLITFTIMATLSGCGTKPVNTDTAELVDTVTTTPTDENSQTVAPTEETKEDSSKNTNQSITLYPAYQTINGEKKYGYIDENGSFVIEPKYTSATDFSEGFAIVNMDDNYQVIDTTGKVIFENPYSIESFKNGAATFTNLTSDYLTRYGFIDTTGKEIIAPSYERVDNFNDEGKAFVYQNGKISVIDKTGTELESYDLDSKYSNIIDFKDGYIIYSDSDTGYAGVVNYKGEIILAPKNGVASYSGYSNISYMGNGLFAVAKTDDNEFSPLYTNPYAIFDNTGKQLTDYTYYDLSTYTGDYASATDDDSTFFIDINGEKVNTLPKVDGRGTLTLDSNLVKAEVDGDLTYLTKDGTTIWKNDRIITLSSDLNLKAVKFKSNKYVTVYYPVLEGLSDETITKKINEEMYHLFVDSRVDLTKEDNLSVEDSFSAELINNVLIVNRIGYDYNFGAAHGMPIKDYYHIDLTTGDMYSLKDLFKTDSDYVTAISDIIKKDIKEQIDDDENSMYFEDAFDHIADNQFFKLNQDSLVIYFYPYDIAPYAAGFPEFTIPYSDLKDLIQYDGALWKALGN